MTLFESIWVACVITGFVMVPFGMVMTYIFFKQLESAYPDIFNLGAQPMFGATKSLKYWRYILIGKYVALDQRNMIFKCQILRIFFLIFLLIYSISLVGIFVV